MGLDPGCIFTVIGHSTFSFHNIVAVAPSYITIKASRYNYSICYLMNPLVIELKLELYSNMQLNR